jgi:hypothetical protein
MLRLEMSLGWGRLRDDGSMKEERSSFLKKRTKKLLIPWQAAFCLDAHRKNQKFFASFFQKRTSCFVSAER